MRIAGLLRPLHLFTRSMETMTMSSCYSAINSVGNDASSWGALNHAGTSSSPPLASRHRGPLEAYASPASGSSLPSSAAEAADGPHAFEGGDSSRPELIDVDCNFLHPDLPNMLSLLLHESTIKSNVACYHSPSSTVDESLEMLEVLADGRLRGKGVNAAIKTSVGVHPYNAPSDTSSGALAKLRDRMVNILEDPSFLPHVACIGEIGLDYSENFPPRSRQLELFRMQASLGCERNLPLFVHSRNSHNDTLDILRELKGQFGGSLPPVMVHCFTGKEEECLDFLVSDVAKKNYFSLVASLSYQYYLYLCMPGSTPYY